MHKDQTYAHTYLAPHKRDSKARLLSGELNQIRTPKKSLLTYVRTYIRTYTCMYVCTCVHTFVFGTVMAT